MNLVFVHGRAQVGKDPAALKQEWIVGLESGIAAAGGSVIDAKRIELPFYGDVLDGLVARVQSGAEAVLDRGAPASVAEFDPFAAAFVDRLAERANVDREEALAELTVVERGPERWEWVQALLRRVERKAPWMGEFAIGRFTADVKAYLHNSYIQSEVDSMVKPAIAVGPCVVVAHSLGTIVAYNILSNDPALEVPLLITAGSPLGLHSIKQSLRHPLIVPTDRWLNLTDEHDLIALFARLDGETFVEGIDNLTDIDNGDSPHSIIGYLSDARVGKELSVALESTR